MNTKTCNECGSDYPRPDGLAEYQWGKSQYCSTACKMTACNRRQRKNQRDRLAGISRFAIPYYDEPSEEVVAEIEHRKAECRAKHFQGLVFAGED